MEIPISLDPDNRQSLQSQLHAQVRTLILGGRLRPGAPLPPSRALAQQLGVSRNTVMLAYQRLTAEGYLQSREALGTFVSNELPESCLTAMRAVPPATAAGDALPARRPIPFRGRAHAVAGARRLPLDFWLGRPDPHWFPFGLWRRLLNRVLAGAGTHFTDYGDPAGLPALRRAIAEHLGPARGIAVDPEQIVVVGGCQEGLDLSARLLLREGDAVAIENPAYQGAAYLYESYRARLLPVHVDDSGLRVADLPDDGAALLYVTPSHQYPMGFMLPLERRLRLLDWAWRTSTYIVEDDYDSDFRYRGSPIPALMGLDTHGCVIYLGTFSKALGAGLRLGYLVVPRQLVGPARTVKALHDNGRPWLEQAVLAEFIASGAYANHLRRIRQVYVERRQCLIDCLREHFGEAQVSGSEGGMHLVWHLPPELPRASALQALAAEHGVGIYTLQSGAAHDFGGGPWHEQVVMLGFSSLGAKQIRTGIERLAAAVAAARPTPPPPSTLPGGASRDARGLPVRRPPPR
jgi:GntR family transcriptional regulator/MocR family aminotransferase